MLLPILLLPIFSTGCASTLTTMHPVSSQGRTIFHQFVFVLILSAIVFLIVFGLLTVILLRFRGRPGDEEPPQTAGNRALEFTWILIPILILIGLAVYSGFTMKSVGADAPDELQINVIGHQWWWEYQYPRYGIDTGSELHLPTGTPVRLNITATDVIHSFWVPDLGWKQDAIPGKTNTMELDLTESGTWDGQCAEFCGAEHAWMRIRVITQSPDQFSQWVSSQRTPPPTPATSLEKRGQQIFNSSTCVNCHVTSRVGPSLTHFGSREWIGSGVLDNTPDNLARWINHVQDVKKGALMPDFHFSDSELQALVAYLEGQK